MATAKAKKKALDSKVRRLAIDLELEQKQFEFCNEYLIDFNIKKSAKRAGYSAQHGYKLIKDKHIIIALKKMQEIKCAYQNISESSLAGQMAIWSQSLITDYYDENWILKKPSELTDNQKSCIASINLKFNKDGAPFLGVTLIDKLKSNENLARPMLLYALDNDDDKLDEKTLEELETWIAENE